VDLFSGLLTYRCSVRCRFISVRCLCPLSLSVVTIAHQTHPSIHPPFRTFCRPNRKELSAAVASDDLVPSDEFHQPFFVSEQVSSSLDERIQKVHSARLSLSLVNFICNFPLYLSVVTVRFNCPLYLSFVSVRCIFPLYLSDVSVR
jgi:hypothetical protein